eukprot:CAMPEP_0198288262 /NCGR_PEP_ID=MMETSP1449-20131203/6826_1 /TAXON_ID=420275 /ORGANISM="Attheya septentrionalis, Strain CCMP2084" /LENGTH=362 /DNA_ID=CAMNT_0043986375 /DNA_START=46 /DNA_END=1134 /DNA_ORIENTATION=+
MGSLPLPPLPQEGDAPCVLMGADAGLNELRQFLWKRDSNATTITVEKEDEDSVPPAGERETEDGRIVLSFEQQAPEETIVLNLPSVRVRLLPTRRDDDDKTHPQTIGTLIVTSRRVLFVSDPKNKNATNDLSLDSSSITLHALQSSKNNNIDDDDDKDQYDDNDDNDNDESEDEKANSPKLGLVYCQLTSGDDEEQGDLEDDSESDISNKNGVRTTPSEVFFTPLHPVTEKSNNDNDMNDSKENTTNNQELCQALFEALSKLASLNPVDHDTFGGGGGGSMFGMMMGMMGDNNNDELVTAWDEPEDDSAAADATETEREAMLDRLDHLLVVPPEYELPDSVEGQFDDADDDDDDDDDDDTLL